ncbi:hypothetical protein KR044_000796 [Drosophila immigrans]|nr:hypothetical protein KR044_000796 [Drosophila immigrans]
MDSVYFNTLHNLTLLPGSFIRQCIEQLNSLYLMELNVYLQFSNGSVIMPVLQPELPTLRPNSSTQQLMLAGNFSERALTIVYLEHSEVASMLDYLTRWLWRVQQLQVLIIYPHATRDDLWQLFTYCWQQGMVHILVLLPETQQLFSYMPYPELRLLLMPNTRRYFQRTRGMLWNFHGFAIRCGILHSAAPRAFLFRDQQDRVVYAGYMLRMAFDFIEHFNGSIRTHTLNSLREANEALTTRAVDFLPYLLAETPNFTGSVVLWHEQSFLMVPSSRPLPRYMYLIKAFSWSTWLACFCMLNYCSVAWFLLSRSRLNVSGAFLQMLRFSLFLSPGGDLVSPPAPRRLLVYSLMIVAGLMLTNLYQAKLSSNLAAGVYDKQLNTFDDLADTDYRLPQAELEFNMLRQLPNLHPQLAKRLVLMPEQLVDRYRLDLNTSMLHNGFEDSIEFALYQQKFLRVPLFHKLSQIVYRQPFFMPCAFGRPYLKIFNFYVRRMFEAGILLKMKSDGFGHGIQSGRLHFVSRARYQEVNSHDLEYYYVAAVVWLCGMLLAALSFSCECWLAARGKRKNGRGQKKFVLLPEGN